MSLINAKENIVKSFNLQDYLLKDFLLKQQLESGWSFNSFFNACLHECYDYKRRISLLTTLREKGDCLSQDDCYSIKDEVIKELLEKAGIPEIYIPEKILVVIGGQTDLDQLSRKIDKVVIALYANQKENKKFYKYSSLKIFSITKACLQLIQVEFKNQLIKKPILGDRTNERYNTSRTKIGERNILHYYKVLDDYILFNLQIFKEHVDETLLKSTNPYYLKSILKNTHKLSKTNIELWEQLSILENNASVLKQQRQVIFNEEKFIIRSEPYNLLINDDCGQIGKIFRNVDFAEFSNNVYIFLSTVLDLATESSSEETEKTLETVYASEVLPKLREALINDKYIAEISETDFIYWLSHRPLNGIQRIKWIKPKGRKMLAYLLAGNIENKKGICKNFSWTMANKCFEITDTERKLDSNDRPKNGYAEIDNIIKSLRPIRATS